MQKNNIIMKCCVCERVKTDRGWNYRFMSLEENNVFSHGYCPSCYRRAIDKLEIDQAPVQALEIAR